MNPIVKQALDLCNQARTQGVHYEEANQLYSKARDLVSDLDHNLLTDNDCVSLLKILNASNENERGFQIAVTRFRNLDDPDIESIIWALAQCAYYHSGDNYPKAMDKLIQINIGTEAEWLLRKAEWFRDVATGDKFREWEWSVGDPIEDHEALGEAARLLAASVERGGYDKRFFDLEFWDDTWRPILEIPEYSHLSSAHLDSLQS